MNKLKGYIALTGLFTIGVGIPYIFGLFGPTEAEVGTWGNAAIFLGVIILILSIFVTIRFFAIVLASVLLIVVLIQIPPTILWFIFHGHGISDGTPPSWFTAHWGFAIPHIFVITAGVWCLLQLYKYRKS